jgi:hypothetical protein
VPGVVSVVVLEDESSIIASPPQIDVLSEFYPGKNNLSMLIVQIHPGKNRILEQKFSFSLSLAGFWFIIKIKVNVTDFI